MSPAGNPPPRNEKPEKANHRVRETSFKAVLNARKNGGER